MLPGRVQAAVLRAEALRRLGQPEGAVLILKQPRVVGQALALEGAVWVRVLVDLGRMDEARAAMVALGPGASPDALASAWYLAQAEGRAAAAADLARRWRALAPNADRDIVQLRPISETP